MRVAIEDALDATRLDDLSVILADLGRFRATGSIVAARGHMNVRYSILFLAATFSTTAHANADCAQSSVSGHFLNEAYPICTVKELDAAAFKAIAAESDHDHLCVKLDSEKPPTSAQLGALAKLPWLTCVQLSGIVELAPLKAFKHLKRLELASAELTDLKFLSSLPALETLSITSDALVDLKPLASQPKLKRLSLVLYAAADLAPIGGLRDLKSLELYGVIESAGMASLPLEKLTNLEVFVTSALTDAKRLAPLTHLKQLALYDQKKLTDVSALAGLTRLETLELDRTGITDVKPLASLVKLTALDLSQTQVKDIGPLASLTALQTLWLSGTEVADIAAVAKLPALEWLQIDKTKVKDLKPVVAIAKHLQNLTLPAGVDAKAVYAAKPSLAQ